MKSRLPSAEYLEKTKQLSNDEIERLLPRMRNRFSRRMEDRKLSAIEAIALQLEYEDDALQEWRERWNEMRMREELGYSHGKSSDNQGIGLS